MKYLAIMALLGQAESHKLSFIGGVHDRPDLAQTIIDNVDTYSDHDRTMLARTVDEPVHHEKI